MRAIHVLKIPMSQELEVDLGDADSEPLAVVQEARDAGRDEGVIVDGLVLRARSRSEAIVHEAEAIGADLIDDWGRRRAGGPSRASSAPWSIRSCAPPRAR